MEDSKGGTFIGLVLIVFVIIGLEAYRQISQRESQWSGSPVVEVEVTEYEEARVSEVDLSGGEHVYKKNFLDIPGSGNGSGIWAGLVRIEPSKFKVVISCGHGTHLLTDRKMYSKFAAWEGKKLILPFKPGNPEKPEHEFLEARVFR